MGLVESRSILAPAAGQGETPFSGLGARRLGKREARAPPAGGVRDPDAPLGNEGRSRPEEGRMRGIESVGEIDRKRQRAVEPPAIRPCRGPSAVQVQRHERRAAAEREGPGPCAVEPSILPGEPRNPRAFADAERRARAVRRDQGMPPRYAPPVCPSGLARPGDAQEARRELPQRVARPEVPRFGEEIGDWRRVGSVLRSRPRRIPPEGRRTESRGRRRRRGRVRRAGRRLPPRRWESAAGSRPPAPRGRLAQRGAEGTRGRRRRRRHRHPPALPRRDSRNALPPWPPPLRASRSRCPRPRTDRPLRPWRQCSHRKRPCSVAG